MAALRLIVGLGNPGDEYAQTRHNAGFWFADRLVESVRGNYGVEAKLHSVAARIHLGAAPVLVLKPATFMNRSGQAVAAALRYFKIEPEQMLVAHDDLDLPPGTARLKFDGGHGGQNGLRDIFSHLGHGRFHRLRIGIGHPGSKHMVTPWVLGQAGRDDEASILRSIDEALDVMPQMMEGDFSDAMKRLHTRRD